MFNTFRRRPGKSPKSGRHHRWRLRGVWKYGVFPTLALLLTVGAGYLKLQHASVNMAVAASTESVQAARVGTVALLTYQPDSADKDLVSARTNLTGAFLDAFTSLTDDVVIPGAKQQRISSTAEVPAAASVSATADHAVVLVFVNQTTTIGADPPTQTASSVKVGLDKIDGRWLISDFAPI